MTGIKFTTEYMAKVKFTYKNWKDIITERNVQPISIRYGSTVWHPEDQWLLKAYDTDKSGVGREFAMKDISNWRIDA